MNSLTNSRYPHGVAPTFGLSSLADSLYPDGVATALGLNSLTNSLQTHGVSSTLVLNSLRPDGIASALGLNSLADSLYPESPVLALSLEDDEVLAATAYQSVRRFEISWRRFMDEVMSVTHGTEWIDRRLSVEIRNRWERRRKQALKSGENTGPLISYADFGDYADIIIKEAVFANEEDIKCALRRLNAVRRRIMHSRKITYGDIQIIADDIDWLRKKIEAKGYRLLH